MFYFLSCFYDSKKLGSLSKIRLYFVTSRLFHEILIKLAKTPAQSIFAFRSEVIFYHSDHFSKTMLPYFSIVKYEFYLLAKRSCPSLASSLMCNLMGGIQTKFQKTLLAISCKSKVTQTIKSKRSDCVLIKDFIIYNASSSSSMTHAPTVLYKLFLRRHLQMEERNVNY